MSLKLKSGFEFDYDNLYGEGKVTDADLKSYEADLKRAHEAMKVMREKGFIRAHLSKDGEPTTSRTTSTSSSRLASAAPTSATRSSSTCSAASSGTA